MAWYTTEDARRDAQRFGRSSSEGAKQLVSKKGGHPFYCEKKRCRKSAWQTPEHLTQMDLETLRLLKGVDSEEAFHAVVYGSQARAEGFFYRVIGWPEGLRYMRGSEAYRQSMWGSVRSNILRALESTADMGMVTEAV